MANLKNALNLTLDEMRTDDGFCCAVYWDDMCADNAIVMFMEYDNYLSMHEVMQDLHRRLTNKLGYPVAICHNHPTDESVLIHGGASRAYYSDECCKKSALECYAGFKKSRSGYRDELKSIFLGAETISALSHEPKETPEDIIEALNWDIDPQAQIISLISSYFE